MVLDTAARGECFDDAAGGGRALRRGLAVLEPRPVQVRGEVAVAGRIAEGLAEHRGARVVRLVAERLHRLAELRPPHPAPAGQARLVARRP